MRHDTDIIGIYPEQLSGYVPLISFKTEGQKQAAENYITEEVDVFFAKIFYNQKKPKYQPIPYSQLITEKDFKIVDIEYFYLNLFYDLMRNPATHKLESTIKWCITFDVKCAPIQLAWHSPHYKGSNPPNPNDETGLPYRKFGTIDINGYPVFYYIHFTLQEILEVIK
ncbi:hypothetical protein [Laspinema olomoucense]|uniref:hypothetical protein n=1 Tax=Laspinema olomoucense TaxID=3231600 RepID=UPI0021BBB2C7|nr:hypothetical protein [Laspinema sp. D3d]MCT7970493.1 hypothetical protein [Laspinema sp. D3d]